MAIVTFKAFNLLPILDDLLVEAIVQRPGYRTSRCVCTHYAGNVGSFSRLVTLSKTPYHTCSIRGQGCKWWSRRAKLTSSVIPDVKFIFFFFFTFMSLA